METKTEDYVTLPPEVLMMIANGQAKAEAAAKAEAEAKAKAEAEAEAKAKRKLAEFIEAAKQAVPECLRPYVRVSDETPLYNYDQPAWLAIPGLTPVVYQLRHPVGGGPWELQSYHTHLNLWWQVEHFEIVQSYYPHPWEVVPRYPDGGKFEFLDDALAYAVREETDRIAKQAEVDLHNLEMQEQVKRDAERYAAEEARENETPAPKPKPTPEQHLLSALRAYINEIVAGVTEDE